MTFYSLNLRQMSLSSGCFSNLSQHFALPGKYSSSIGIKLMKGRGGSGAYYFPSSFLFFKKAQSELLRQNARQTAVMTRPTPPMMTELAIC